MWRLPAERAPAGTRVIILGAGVAGLASAYELRKLGYECEILEARPRIGGRAFTVRRGQMSEEIGTPAQKATFDEDLYLNAGAARIPHHHTTTLDYCRELGVAIEPFCSVNEAAYVHQTSAAPAAQRLRLREVRADWRGQTSELLAKAVSTDALDRQVTAEDRDRIVEWLKLEGGLNADLRYAGSARRGYAVAPGFGKAAGVVGDPLQLEALLRTGFGKYLVDRDQRCRSPMFQVVGGTDGIVRALAGESPARSRLAPRSQAIEQPAGRVRVRYTTADGVAREEAGHYCISTLAVAAPARHVARRLARAALGGRRRQLLERRQDRSAVLAPFLGGGRRDLRRHHAHRSGDYADSLSVDRLPDVARGPSSATTRRGRSPARWASWPRPSGCSAPSTRAP